MPNSSTVKPTSAGQKAPEQPGAPKSTPNTGTKPETVGSHARLDALAQTTEFRWFVAHFLVVLHTLLALVFFRAPKLANFAYRGGLVSAFASFFIILLQTYGRNIPSVAVLAKDDNFQYAVYTLFWLFTQRRTLALLPLAIFSVFHVLTFTRSYLLPAVGHPPTSALIKRIDQIIKSYNEPMTVLAANFELVLTLQLLLTALTFQKGSWVQLGFYVLFYRLRYATSAYTRHAIKAWEIRADQLLGHPSLPPVVRQVWAEIKQNLAKFPGPANKA